MKLRIAVIIAVLVGGFALGSWALSDKGRAGGLVFRPATINIDGKYHTGEDVKVMTSLVNTSDATLQVTGFMKSCGCMAVGENSELTLPITLRPGERRPLKVAVSTKDRSGNQTYILSAKASSAREGEETGATLTIQGKLITGMVAFPDEILIESPPSVSDAEFTRTIILADEYPGGGMGVASVESTADDRVRYVIKPSQGKVIVSGLSLAVRYKMDIHYRVPRGDGPFRDVVTVRPNAPGAQPVQITLITKRLREFEVVPDNLLFYSPTSPRIIERSLEYRYHDSSISSVTFADLPEAITVEERSPAPSGNRKRFTVRCAIPDGAKSFQTRIALRVGRSARTVDIPVSVVVGE